MDNPVEYFPKLLGQNLVAARTANQLTQQELADLSSISRATITEIESGSGDPRLSTVATLAGALNTSPMMLLLEKSSLEAASQLQGISLGLVSQASIAKMHGYLNSSSRAGAQQAAKEGIRALGAGGAAGVGAAIGSVLFPGLGTIVGAALGGLLGVQATNAGAKEGSGGVSLHEGANSPPSTGT